MLKHETDERQSRWFQRQAWRREPKESVLLDAFQAGVGNGDMNTSRSAAWVSMWLCSIALGCSTGGVSVGSTLVDRQGNDDVAAGAPDPHLTFNPQTPCYDGDAPSGASCVCHYSNCTGTELECECDKECYKARSDCLIFVDDKGKASSKDPFLSACQLSCEYQQARGATEFRQDAAMLCKASSCDARPVEPEPSTGGESTPSPPDSASTSNACPVPVPGSMIIKGPVWAEYNVQFRVPHVSWAFATAHASKQMEALGASKIALRESPSMFFATALKESYMGCSDLLPEPDPYHLGQIVRRYNSYADGCFQVESTTAWVELCRMYPGEFDCSKVTHADVISSSKQAQTKRDNFASSTFIKAYYDTFAYAMLPNLDMSNPNQWFATAADPQAMDKVTALLFNTGAWSGDVSMAARRCHGDLIEKCLGNKDYVIAVSSVAKELSRGVQKGKCYNDPVSATDIDDYIDRILALFVREDGSSIKRAARAAFDTAARGASTSPFQQVAPDVLRAIDQKMQAKVHCPDAQLQEWYGRRCPTT